MLENSEYLAVPVRRGRCSKLEDGRASKGNADPVRYDWMVNYIASMLVLRTLLVESRNLGI